jgi:archaellum component FlaC
MGDSDNWVENRKMVLHEIKRTQELLDKLYDRIDRHGDAIVTEQTERTFSNEKIEHLSEKLDELTEKYANTANDVNSLKTKAYIFATLAAIGVTAALEVLAALVGN